VEYKPAAQSSMYHQVACPQKGGTGTQPVHTKVPLGDLTGGPTLGLALGAHCPTAVSYTRANTWG
jgi:hypothetical protein